VLWGTYVAISLFWDPQNKRSQDIGCYASEEDAARAYVCAAVQAHGPGAECNFPGEANSELPETVGEKRKQRSSSHYIGVTWHMADSSWRVRLTEPQTKRKRQIGSFASEQDAARAYDCAAVQAHGPGTKRNSRIGSLASCLRATSRSRAAAARASSAFTFKSPARQGSSSRLVKASSSWHVPCDQITPAAEWCTTYVHVCDIRAC
jgi:hypothetical protein